MASVTVIFNRQEVKTYPLEKERTVVGRDPGSDIPIDNVGISRQHCALVAQGTAFTVEDLGSSNGTFVNGKRIAQHYLNDGDEVVMGKYVLRFSNEAQGKAAERDDGVVPGTVDTFVMDGQKIKEQLARLRAQSGPSAAAPAIPAKAVPSAPEPQVAAAPSKAADAMKGYLAVSVVFNLVLFLAFVALLVLYLVK